MSEPELRAVDYIEHILGGIRNIENYTRGLTEKEFSESRIAQDAVFWNFVVIGEASRSLLQRFPDFVAKHQDLQLAAAYGIRNRLAHGYHKISLQIVWATLRSDLPALRLQIERILVRSCDSGLGGGRDAEVTNPRPEEPEQRRHQSVENWLKYREAQKNGGAEKSQAENDKEDSRGKARSRGLDDDL